MTVPGSGIAARATVGAVQTALPNTVHRESTPNEKTFCHPRLAVCGRRGNRGSALRHVPGADDDLRRHGTQLSQDAVDAGGHGEHRVESGLQRRPLPRSSTPLVDAVWPNAAVGDWPSYNRTPTSQRYSPLNQINTKNVANLKVLCTYDLGVFTSFESGLIMVNNALIGTTEFDIFSINPATCAENWRTHLDYPGALLPSNRGAAYMDGMLFRGTQDGRVLAFDFKTGKQVWETTIATRNVASRCRRPRSPGTASSTSAIPAETTRAAKAMCTRSRGRPAKSYGSFFSHPRLKEIQSEALWASRRSTRRPGTTRPASPSAAAEPGPRTPSTSRMGCCTSREAIRPLTSPRGHAKATNLFTDSVVVLDAKTGDFKNNFKVVKKDWHDWDVSSPPILLQTMGGKQLMSVARRMGTSMATISPRTTCSTACR